MRAVGRETSQTPLPQGPHSHLWPSETPGRADLYPPGNPSRSAFPRVNSTGANWVPRGGKQYEVAVQNSVNWEMPGENNIL